MVGGVLAPTVPWHAMVFLSEKYMDGGYGGGALISDRWVLTAGRNLFVRRNRQQTQGVTPRIPKVYLGISSLEQANETTEVAVEKVSLSYFSSSSFSCVLFSFRFCHSQSI